MGHLATALGPLRHRNFALVWSAALVSNIGSWLQTVAVGILVTDLTHQAGWAGLVAAAGFLPMGLLSPVGGAVADRVDRRRWLLATTVGETVLAAALAILVATGNFSAGIVTLMVLAAGCMTALGFPAYQAMLPDLVGPDDLLGAVSLSSAQYNMGRVIGPALAGIVIVAGSYTLAFVLNAVSFAAVIVALIFVRLPVREVAADNTGIRRRIADGARAAAAEPGCRAAIGLIAIVALLVSPFIALIPAFALRLFGERAGGASTLVTAQGVGAVTGALLLAPAARRWGRVDVLGVNLVVLPLAVLAYSLAPSLAWAAVGLFLVGAAYIGVLSGLSTVVQLRAPAGARARVLSLFMVALGSVYPLGAVLQGWAGDHIGLRQISGGCALAFLAVVVTLKKFRPALVAALDG